MKKWVDDSVFGGWNKERKRTSSLFSRGRAEGWSTRSMRLCNCFMKYVLINGATRRESAGSVHRRQMRMTTYHMAMTSMIACATVTTGFVSMCLQLPYQPIYFRSWCPNNFVALRRLRNYWPNVITEEGTETFYSMRFFQLDTELLSYQQLFCCDINYIHGQFTKIKDYV